MSNNIETQSKESLDDLKPPPLASIGASRSCNPKDQQRKLTLAFELSNEDNSADIYFNSYNKDEFQLDRKYSTITHFEGENHEKGNSDKKKDYSHHSKKRYRKTTSNKDMRKVGYHSKKNSNEFRPSRNEQYKYKHKEEESKDESSHSDRKREKNEQSEEEKHHQPNSHHNPTSFMISPSKIEDAHRIFSKHQRFSFYPKQQHPHNNHQSNHDKRGESDQVNTYQSSKFRNRDNKFNDKQGGGKKYHTKYKYQTYQNQLKKVPPAPLNNNQYLINNNNYGFVDPNFLQLTNSPRLFQDSLTARSPYESILNGQTFFNNSVNDLGASMNFLVGSDSFLEENLESDHNKHPQNIETTQLTDRHQENKIKREQMIHEIQQQKNLIKKLLSEISSKDKILKDIQVRMNNNISPSDNDQQRSN